MTRDDGYTRYTVRIPTPLYERVKLAAGEKSVNAEILAALNEKYPEPEETAFGQMLQAAARIDKITEEMETSDLSPERWSTLLQELREARMALQQHSTEAKVVFWPGGFNPNR